jgi:hypothetical protein
MRLLEMFSPIGAPETPDQDIDWLGDLKFFIDNNDNLLNQHFFPAINKHKKYKGNPNAYKLYVKAFESCLEQYCEQFNIDNKEEKFTKEQLIQLSKDFASQQEKFLDKGDYDK